MSVPMLLALSALAASAVALMLPGLSDLILVTLPSFLAAVWLWLRAPRGNRRPARTDRPPSWRRTAKAVSLDHSHAAPLRPIVIDGSNVLFWKDNSPMISTLRMVINRLKASGYAPGVVFDANAGYLLTGRYQHDGNLARMLDLPEDQVLVVARGTPADPTILQIARSLQAPVLSNDRYRDWQDTYPEVSTPGHVLRGRIDETGLSLDLPQMAQAS
jgi:hypothetical protein